MIRIRLKKKKKSRSTSLCCVRVCACRSPPPSQSRKNGKEAELLKGRDNLSFPRSCFCCGCWCCCLCLSPERGSRAPSREGGIERERAASHGRQDTTIFPGGRWSSFVHQPGTPLLAYAEEKGSDEQEEVAEGGRGRRDVIDSKAICRGGFLFRHPGFASGSC